MEKLESVATEIQQILRLRTLPVAIKFFKTEEEMMKVPKVRRMPERLSFCQVVTLCRTIGWTVGVTARDLCMPDCIFMLGLAPPPAEGVLDGRVYVGVWMRDQKDAARYAQSKPRLPYGRHRAVAVSPVASGRLENPDVVLVYGNPGQLHLLMCALQWEDYERLVSYFTGEGSCADSLVECYMNKKPYLSVPCYGQRRFGHVQDDELELAIPPGQLEKALSGLNGLRQAGASYPIPQYGPMASPLPAISKIYPEIPKFLEALDKGLSG